MSADRLFYHVNAEFRLCFYPNILLLNTLSKLLNKIKSNNVQGEFYLTDIIELGYREGKVVGVLVGDDSEEIVGINTVHDLMMVENILRNRIRNKS